MLVNARHVKNVPGRKTDVADATWLAQLGAHGLVAGSFVPPAPIRDVHVYPSLCIASDAWQGCPRSVQPWPI
jgi:hypothetical protein